VEIVHTVLSSDVVSEVSSALLEIEHCPVLANKLQINTQCLHLRCWILIASSCEICK